MHPILKNLMAPIHDGKHHFAVKTLVLNAGMTKVGDLPTNGNFCFRALLGMYKGKEGGTSKCHIRDINVHPKPSQIPDDYARKLAEKLLPGVRKFVDDKRAQRNN